MNEPLEVTDLSRVSRGALEAERIAEDEDTEMILDEMAHGQLKCIVPKAEKPSNALVCVCNVACHRGESKIRVHRKGDAVDAKAVRPVVPLQRRSE